MPLSDPAVNLRCAVQIVLSTALSGAAYFLSTGLGEYWPLAWIAPVPVLTLAFRSSAGTAAAVAFLAYLLGSLNLLSYLLTVMPVGAVAATLLVPAVAFALAVLAARRGSRSSPSRLPGLRTSGCCRLLFPMAPPAAWPIHRRTSSPSCKWLRLPAFGESPLFSP